MADNSSTSLKERRTSDDQTTIDDQTLKNLRPLVSMEYVRVNKIDSEFDNEELDDEFRREFDMIGYEEKTTLVCGTVIITDCWGDDLVYHRYPGCCETITDKYISLIGPSRPISSHDNFTISVNMWASVLVQVRGKDEDEEMAINDELDIFIDKEISRGEIEWDLRTRPHLLYEGLLEEDVIGKRGSVTVGYSVIREALSATVKVAMMMTESIPQFYGTIKAERSFGGLTTTRILFDRSRDHRVRVAKPFIPLDGPIFPLSVHSYLTIEVDLWNHDDNLMSPDYQIAMATVQFPTKFGEQMESITTNYGEVQVYITCE